MSGRSPRWPHSDGGTKWLLQARPRCDQSRWLGASGGAEASSAHTAQALPAAPAAENAEPASRVTHMGRAARASLLPASQAGPVLPGTAERWRMQGSASRALAGDVDGVIPVAPGCRPGGRSPGPRSASGRGSGAVDGASVSGAGEEDDAAAPLPDARGRGPRGPRGPRGAPVLPLVPGPAGALMRALV